MNRSLLKIISLVIAVLMVTGTIGSTFAQDSETLNILYWQAPTTLNPYLSTGTKDNHAGSLILEPLARYDENGNMVAFLVQDVPTVANGGVSEDLTTITWKLKDGLVWSDGTPVTADDAVFSWQYCTDEATGCTQTPNFADVSKVEAVDAQTIKITFGKPKPFPYGPFVGNLVPLLQKAQFKDCIGANAASCTTQNFGPIGTGPYMVEEFKTGDTITYVANPKYREPGKPFFKRVVLKGGGDAQAAAQAVLQTGEVDYSWNLQVLPEVLKQMEAAGIGTIVTAYGSQVERLHLNQTNPDSALGPDKRSTYMEDGSNKHPFLTDPAVYKALSMAIDRQAIADQVYGPAGKPTCNLVPAPAIYVSTNNDACLKQDIEGAKKLLDDAGWVVGSDGIREKDGVKLHILYQTTVNAVRQANQALVKQWWSEIGVDTELKSVDAAVFFGNDLASADTATKLYADVEMYTNNFDGTDPEVYMGGQTCDQMPTQANNWGGQNVSRWCNPEYDKLQAELGQTADLNARAAIVIKENDLYVQTGGIIPLIHRGSVSGYNNSIEGIKMNPWDSELWNIADWTRKS
jgi:peptide/nickel transport system substrate-binding protein